MGHPGEVLAYIEDGPHGVETVAAEPDGSAPYEIELQDPVPPAELYVGELPQALDPSRGVEVSAGSRGPA
jgi:hypothetical protein